MFAIGSVLTPFFLGAALGGIASGRVPEGNAAGDIWTSWANPSGAMVGALAVAACAFVAAVYLTADARRYGDAALERHFRLRGLVAGVVTGALAIGGILVLRSDAPRTYDRLIHEALPLVLISAALGVATVVLLALRRPLGTRLMSAGAVAAVVWAWGVAQWPYILPETLTLLGGRRRRRDAALGRGGLRDRADPRDPLAGAAVLARPAQPPRGGLRVRCDPDLAVALRPPRSPRAARVFG